MATKLWTGWPELRFVRLQFAHR